ncbi:MAG: iron-containing alcohol dehydrogenase [Chloroflexota bacterium]
MSDFDKAKELIREFKGDRYVYGSGVLPEVGRLTVQLGQRAAIVRSTYAGTDAIVGRVEESLARAGVQVLGQIPGAGPNAPREDVFRIAASLKTLVPGVIVAVGAGSTIDAAKAAEVLRTLGGSIDSYFGLGKVTDKLKETGQTLTPIVGVQTAASSGAHLTKYSNVTDVTTGQKKVIVDLAVVPQRAVFDYDLSKSMSPAFTADGAFDGVAHALEALYDSVGKPYHDKMMQIAHEVIFLVVKYVERAVKDPNDTEARTALGLATDLGGYSIMVGGTNGGHLTSFSLVDILSHGRACAIMNPYYTVFFAPRVEEPLRMVGKIFKDAGLTDAEVDKLRGRELGIAVARAMIALGKRIGFPTTLGETPGFTDEHITRALTAAKDPQLKSKLDNMPVPLSADMIDEYMGSVLRAAKTGDLDLIKNVA